MNSERGRDRVYKERRGKMKREDEQSERKRLGELEEGRRERHRVRITRERKVKLKLNDKG